MRSRWAESYSASLRLMEVDPATWADTDEVPGVLDASGSRDATGKLLESGRVTVEWPTDAKPKEMWGRVELLADHSDRRAVMTLLLVPSPSDVRRGRRTLTYDGYSVLSPADERHLMAGDYVPAGADGAKKAADLIAECTPAPVVAEGSFRLAEPMVFAQGTTYLDAAWMLVDAAGWCMQVDGDGTVRIRPMPTVAALQLDADGAGLLGTEVESDDGFAGVPNSYVAVEGGEVATAVDDDPSSPTSTVSRGGRVVQIYDAKPTRIDGESLGAYAARKLAEATATVGRRSYTRAWVPDVTVFDMVDGTLSEADLVGKMRIVRQALDITGNMTVNEECEVLR